MSDYRLRFRQIHMDFHTSEAIPAVGGRFDADEFAETLARAKVNSVTCFARGHHGWLYYDSKLFPERIHPTLQNRNLLGEQIAACHARDIRVPIYITVQWDLFTAREHPEWRIVEASGKLQGTPPFEPGFYGSLCVNTPYRDFLKAQTQEVLETMPVDGLFFDIVGVRPCVCGACQAGMRAAGLRPDVAADRARYAKDMLDEFKLDMTALVRKFSADCSIFYNAGHVGYDNHESQSAYSHWELESLPSGGWGYGHFPLAQRFARTLGLDCLGMTGKFHTSWGDFHSFKSRAALEFECFHMLALNAKCSIGDQLPPDGKICPHVYELIGGVFAQVEAKEPWCVDAKAVVEIGVVSPEQFTGERVPTAAAGAMHMLEELGRQFDVLDTASDLAPYKLVILPDQITVDESFGEKLRAYLAGGGKLIASLESGLNPDKSAFALAELGVTLRPNPTLDADGVPVRGRTFPRGMYVDYVLPKGAMAAGLPPTEHVMYVRGAEVDVADGAAAEVLAETIAPYFDRSWEHFCSHAQTPSSGEVAGPAVVNSGECIYFSHSIFSEYNRIAPPWCRQLLANALDILLPEALLTHDGPSTLSATINTQEAKGRWVVHLLHYIPERRCREIDVLEDVIPLGDLTLTVRTGREVTGVRCVPEDRILDFTQADGCVTFTLDRLEGHQMIELVQTSSPSPPA